MTACPDANLLARLADGEVGDAERATVEAHLDGCAACARAVSELGALAVGARGALGYRWVESCGPDRWIADDRDGRRVVVQLVRGAAERRAEALRAAAALVGATPPGLAPVLAAETDGDAVVIATAATTGPTARARLAGGAPRAELLAAWRAAITAVAALHARGIAHDGVSPDAIRATPSGVVVDGFAATVEEPAYVAPERRRGGPPSAAADQFALCAGLWEALAGRRPYPGATAGALAVAMRAPLALPDRDRARFAALRRGLAEAPDDRWPDLAALAAALDRAGRRAWPRWARVVGVAAILAGAAALVWALVT